MRNPLGPSIDASARVVFEALASTVEVESPSERQALFPRYARYHALLSRLLRRLQRSCSRGRRSLNLSTWRDGLLVMLLVLATPLAYAQSPPPPVPTPPVNVPPVANDDTGATSFNIPIVIEVVTNDTDADGNLDPASVAIVGNPTNGTAVPNGSGAVTYTPAAGFFGPDSFSYTVNDNQGATSNVATVTVAVINAEPVAEAGPGQTAVALTLVTLNGSGNDPDSGPNPLTFRWGFAPVAAGSLLTDANITNATTPQPSFTPDVAGLYRLTLTVSDGDLSASDDVAINITPAPADLELSLTDTPDPLTVDGQLTYTITVRNNGPGTATGVLVEDSLPPEAALAGPAFSSQGLCEGTVMVICDLGTLAPGAHNQATVTINVNPKVPGDLSNAAEVFSDIDPDPANNTSPETTTVKEQEPGKADLAVTAEATLTPGASGPQLTYKLTVTNDGPATATGVQLTNVLPSGVGLRQITPSQTCHPTDPVQCDLDELPSGATAIVTIDVIPSVETTLPNLAAINGDQHDPDLENNFALTSAVDLPTRKTTCTSKGCRVELTCNLSDLLRRRCKNRFKLFVDTRMRRDTRARLSDERVARGPRLVRFAAAIRNSPGGETKKVQLKLTPEGREVASMLVQQGRKKLRGEMRITNATGGIDIIRLTVRLR